MEPCPNCGQPVRSTARFCTSCGYRVPERAQGSTGNSAFASTWVEESTGVAAEPVAGANTGSTWPAAPAGEVVAAVETVEVVPDVIYAPPAIAVDPIAEIVAAGDSFDTDVDSIADLSQNRINIALYHIETLRQLVPELSAWSEERAQSVNTAIAAMEAAIKGREADDVTYNGLRQTVAAARTSPRDIDVMVALCDRALDIQDLLAAHDKYSIGIRTALIDLKPLAVEYVRVPAKRRPPARKPSTTTRSRATAAKATTPAKTAPAKAPSAKTPSAPAKSAPATAKGATSRSTPSGTTRKSTSKSS